MTRFLWITDPWDTLDHPRDTTLRLIEESLALGHESFICDVQSIRMEGGTGKKYPVVLEARQVSGVFPGRSKAAFRLGEIKTYAPHEFKSLQYRVDPPIDHAYIHPLQLL